MTGKDTEKVDPKAKDTMTEGTQRTNAGWLSKIPEPFRSMLLVALTSMGGAVGVASIGVSEDAMDKKFEAQAQRFDSKLTLMKAEDGTKDLLIQQLITDMRFVLKENRDRDRRLTKVEAQIGND